MMFHSDWMTGNKGFELQYDVVDVGGNSKSKLLWFHELSPAFTRFHQLSPAFASFH